MQLKKALLTAGFVGAMLASAAVQALPLGNLNDGLDHTSATTGYWSLFVNAGDNVTVTARRLVAVDIWGFAMNGPDGTGTMLAWGDDNLGPYVGGPWGDPQFSFTAATTGEYSIGVFRCCNGGAWGTPIFEGINYFVNAHGATGSAVPESGTLALAALGLLGIGGLRRRRVH